MVRMHLPRPLPRLAPVWLGVSPRYVRRSIEVIGTAADALKTARLVVLLLGGKVGLVTADGDEVAGHALWPNDNSTFSARVIVSPMKRLIAALLLSAAALAQSSNPSGAANVVRYKLDESKLKYLFATSEPVLHLKPGDILETNTVDAFGNAIQKPGDTLSM